MEEVIRQFLAVPNHNGFGFCSGYGSGDGDGFCSGYGSGYGSAAGYGYGSGSGCGYGDGSGYGSGDGYGDGSGSGDGYDDGWGTGDGTGDGYGYGYGSGCGYGDGSGYGYGYGVTNINGQKVYHIDNTSTLIDSVHGNYAKGRILRSDLTMRPCYVARVGDWFAHGCTLREAMADAQAKYDEHRPLEERIANFNREFPDRDVKVDAARLFEWHHILTGSCLAGRKAFCEDRGLDYEHGKYTVNEFIRLTRNAYGGEAIEKLEKTLP